MTNWLEIYRLWIESINKLKKTKKFFTYTHVQMHSKQIITNRKWNFHQDY